MAEMLSAAPRGVGAARSSQVPANIRGDYNLILSYQLASHSRARMKERTWQISCPPPRCLGWPSFPRRWLQVFAAFKLNGATQQHKQTRSRWLTRTRPNLSRGTTR